MHAQLKRIIALSGLSSLIAASACNSVEDGTEPVAEAKQWKRHSRPKNVILFIGDGMGDSEITIARNYLQGAAGKLHLDRLPFTAQMTTYSVDESDPQKPDYTPESASTATAFSTGIKTSDGRISTTPATDMDVATLLELAEEAGYATGVVTTSELTDATAAAMVSHVRLRACQGPANMATCPQDLRSAGGPGSIAEQSVLKGAEVLFGGGRARYEQIIPVGEGPYAGQSVLQVAMANGYALATDRTALLAASAGQKVLGLFHAGNMSTQWTGLPASNPPNPSPGQRCNENQRPANEPSLDEMTRKALELLETHGQTSGRGLFLLVESASIDKRNHAGQPCEQIGETANLDRAVQVGRSFAAHHPDTLLVITGDHAHTSQIVDLDATPAGFSSRLVTNEGASMLVSYGTGKTVSGQEHTGSQIRVAAEGPSGHRVRGLLDQTDVFYIIADMLEIAP